MTQDIQGTGSFVQPSTEQLAEGNCIAAGVLNEFGYDFVGLSIVPPIKDPELTWQCAAGNTNNRFRRIVLPAKVGVLGIVFSEQQSIVVHDVDNNIERRDLYQYPIVAAEGLSGFLALPLLEGDRVARIIIGAFRGKHDLGIDLLRETQRFAAQCTGLRFKEGFPIMPSKTSREPVYTEVTHKILQAQEDERKRVARELHDGLSHEILLAQIELRKLKYLPAERKDEGIEQASEQLREIMTHVSALATGLRPAALDELGLATAIVAQCASLQNAFGVQVNVDVDTFKGVNGDFGTALYRIFQEATMNACKYSRTESIDVSLSQNEDFLTMCVVDHGVGFDASSPELLGGGLGLAGMRERAELIGGILIVESVRGVGTTITVQLNGSSCDDSREGV